MIGGYIFSSEVICLGIAVFLLFLMVYSRPKRTYIYDVDFAGTIFSIAALVMEFIIAIVAMYPQYLYHKLSFDIFCFVFLLLYMCVLTLIVIYMYLLAAVERGKKQTVFLIASCIIYAIYIAAAAYLIHTGRIYSYANGVLKFDFFVQYYVAFGILGAIFSFVVSMKNRQMISRTVFTYILLFVPLDLILLIAQMLFPSHIFSGVTYVFPFLIFYILFHSNPYDDITGAQNDYAFESKLQQAVARKKKYTVLFITLPQLSQIDFYNYLGNEKMVKDIYADTCRKIERLDSKIYVHRMEESSFALFWKRKETKEADTLLQVTKLIEDACNKANNTIYYRMVAFHDHEVLKSTYMIGAFAKYLFRKAQIGYGNQQVIAEEKDYEEYAYQYRVEQMLLDIRKNMNLDDERVLCYVQPIYSTEDGKFHTAEALMRLKMKDEIVYPDKFIRLAEENNCIHALTCIMLNKVAKNYAKLPTEYGFEAITVNCSSTELSSARLYEEIAKIIQDNQIAPSAIRLELTESAMFDNFSVVLKNLTELDKFGIKFYLDDFGTGYSNLERIISCPFHTIKFDKSLLYKSLEDSGMEELIREMIQVFKKKDFHALVEGVEDEGQRAFCVEHGFEYIQGYYYSRPIPVEELPQFLEKNLK